ncbi:MAG: 2-amino-5-chloromuconate deaminase CnbZ [Stellaceae bacterium]
MPTQLFAPGGYRFLPYAFQYSGGAVAEPGFVIERVRFARLVPLAEGFAAIEAYLARLGRPPTALCACELRSPAQFTEAGFIAFNRHYVERLAAWGIFRDEINPVARTNVCPDIEPPAAPSFHAFSYTVPGGGGGFVVAGSGEARGGGGGYDERIVRLGDTSPAGLREKTQCVLAAMETRLGGLGRGWGEVTATQLYTVYDPHPFLAEDIVRRGAMPAGLTWHYARPPVQGLEIEIDVRGVSREYVV